jgi:hypothetical protein
MYLVFKHSFTQIFFKQRVLMHSPAVACSSSTHDGEKEVEVYSLE